MSYALPDSLEEALALRASGDWCVVAGGTDVYPARVETPDGPRGLLDISALRTLAAVDKDATHWRIGALATWTDLINAPLPAGFDALKQAAREVGSVQIQNVGTVVGNLCNASPAADGVPPLLVLDAQVEIASVDATRVVPLGEFIRGNRQTILAENELVTAILIPRSHDAAPSRFVKLGARRYLVISIAMVAAQLSVDDQGLVDSARVAVGSCSAVAARLPRLEAALQGMRADPGLLDAIDGSLLPELSPIDDIRASASYRSDAAVEIVKRAVSDCIERIS